MSQDSYNVSSLTNSPTISSNIFDDSNNIENEKMEKMEKMNISLIDGTEIYSKDYFNNYRLTDRYFINNPCNNGYFFTDNEQTYEENNLCSKLLILLLLILLILAIIRLY